ncbi:hypothetical protein MTBBW1_2720004 [Desulfamplus magnetovallimortis]|uniref:Uncharacterized protein n=1 Tax=Desulfamplus magnetovallimortis TaxID=1246637 RepID=A0A1W1HF69_9BACT|nr:hypothetical protein [Desulfamplus magnetovallimortis]SLM31127.1 hypothetical protein MTBBW1_2720004 [Desulfamplus magnetovallimortis]
MTRIALTDRSGKWFDEDKATRFDNKTDWNGSDHVSLSAGEHCTHILYRTASKRWVLNEYSRWEGVQETYTEISDQEAAEWFMVNEFENEEIPEDLLPLLKSHIDNLEV